MNINKLHKECKKIGEKSGIKVKNCRTDFEFKNVKNGREAYLNDYALKNMSKGKSYEQAAKSIMRYIKSDIG